ncbi:pyroglutamyl-peptidase I [Acinetobacter puyangensis]|uniref:pyroglutamyl-peptidase I n=1 Tax=Acinetobacter puyangensis TaxID=1096779 RepID=UPI003A4DC237
MYLPSPTVLVTGFEAFDTYQHNPSWTIAQALDQWQIQHHVVHARQLPCEFHRASQTLLHGLQTWQPALVICLGLATNRSAISLERIAINIDDANIPDNAGQQPMDEKIQLTGPAAYFSNLPIKAMLHAIREQQIACEISNTAGTFVCNHVFYNLMHYLQQHAPQVRAGFIHVPAFSGSGIVSPAAMDLIRHIQAIQIAISTALLTSQDRPMPAGHMA